MPKETEGQMTEERAREILGSSIAEKGGVYSENSLISGELQHVFWGSDDNKIIELSGIFTADQLEAVAWWTRNNGKEQKEMTATITKHDLNIGLYIFLHSSRSRHWAVDSRRSDDNMLECLG